MRLRYGSFEEKIILAGGFFLASAAALALLAEGSLLSSPFLWLSFYLSLGGLVLSAVSFTPLHQTHAGSLLYRALPALFLAGGIALGSSFPMTPGEPLPVPDYVLHSLEFAGLAFLTVRLLHPVPYRAPLTGAFVWAFFLILGYAALDEWHQRFVPGRDSSLRDLAADGVGIAVGLLAYRWLYFSRESHARNLTPEA